MDRLTRMYRLLCRRLGSPRLAAPIEILLPPARLAFSQSLVIRNHPQLEPRRISRRSGRFPYRIISWSAVALIGVGLLGAGRLGVARESNAAFDAMIARHAKANEIPESLIRRVIWRESKYNPGLIGRGNAMGLMQIKPATAREVGYSGSSSGLLDAETNMKYATRYLAGAYRVAGGNADRAVALYAKGYYFEAKRRGMLATMYKHRASPDQGGVREAALEDNPAAHAASFQLASAEPPTRDVPARVLPGARVIATETIRKQSFVPDPKNSRDVAPAARNEPVRIAAVVPAIPLPRDKPFRLASAARETVLVRDVAAVRHNIPAREPVSAHQLAAAREAAVIAPDSFATGDLFVPHATPVIADATPRYTTASVRTLSDAPSPVRVLDPNKIAAVEAPRTVEPASAPERIEPVAKPASAAKPAAAPHSQPQAVVAPEPTVTPPPVLASAPAKRERAANRVGARARAQQNAAPAPLQWLEQQFASLGRSMSAQPQRRPRRTAAR
jgi:hypothetical protein